MPQFFKKMFTASKCRKISSLAKKRGFLTSGEALTLKRALTGAKKSKFKKYNALLVNLDIR